MAKPRVTVVDYGAGNLLSVRRGLERCDAEVVLTSDPDTLLNAERVVLPGVGAFESAMQALCVKELTFPLQRIARRGTPLLGICLGMQLLLDDREEFGITAGLGIIPGRVVPIPRETVSGMPQKIPHIGWSALHPADKPWKGTLLEDVKQGEAAYFLHSFMADPTDPTNRIADCLYGGHRVSALIGNGSTTGCQFHPEKSGEFGLKILRRFVES